MLIKTERFHLRPLNENDATEKYLNWLISESRKEFILSASDYQSIESIKEYILNIENSVDAILFGIFENETKVHIGNIKYGPISKDNGSAVMGILIGDESWRGKGVAPEVIRASSKYLHSEMQIKKIILGVKAKNIAAVKSYSKIGFIRVTDPDFENNGEAIKMCLDTNSIK